MKKSILIICILSSLSLNTHAKDILKPYIKSCLEPSERSSYKDERAKDLSASDKKELFSLIDKVTKSWIDLKAYAQTAEFARMGLSEASNGGARWKATYDALKAPVSSIRPKLIDTRYYACDIVLTSALLYQYQVASSWIFGKSDENMVQEVETLISMLSKAKKEK